jgi:hypothetical protein
MIQMTFNFISVLYKVKRSIYKRPILGYSMGGCQDFGRSRLYKRVRCDFLFLANHLHIHRHSACNGRTLPYLSKQSKHIGLQNVISSPPRFRITYNLHWILFPLDCCIHSSGSLSLRRFWYILSKTKSQSS